MFDADPQTFRKMLQNKNCNVFGVPFARIPVLGVPDFAIPLFRVPVGFTVPGSWSWYFVVTF